MGLLNLASGTSLWRGYGESRHISEVKGRITDGNAHNAYVFEKLRMEYLQDDPAFLNVLKNLTKHQPKKLEALMRNLNVREYILKLPVLCSKKTTL